MEISTTPVTGFKVDCVLLVAAFNNTAFCVSEKAVLTRARSSSVWITSQGIKAPEGFSSTTAAAYVEAEADGGENLITATCPTELSLTTLLTSPCTVTLLDSKSRSKACVVSSSSPNTVPIVGTSVLEVLVVDPP